jgi:hypothetical protein
MTRAILNFTNFERARPTFNTRKRECDLLDAKDHISEQHRREEKSDEQD